MSDAQHVTQSKSAGPDLPDIVRKYIDAYNRRDPHGMLACLAKDVSFQNIQDDKVTDDVCGLEAFGQLARAAVDLFSEREQRIVDAITVAGTTVARLHYTATPAKDLPNGWRTGQNVTLSGWSLFEVSHGKICRIVDQS